MLVQNKNYGLILPDGGKSYHYINIKDGKGNINGVNVYNSDDVSEYKKMTGKDITKDDILFYTSYTNRGNKDITPVEFAKINKLKYDNDNLDFLRKGYVGSFQGQEEANNFFNQERPETVTEFLSVKK